jgi:acyl-coenzyme A synthetase/AMP-(fatty) acid ligase
MIIHRRRGLAALVPERGVAVLAIDDIVENWILVLALHSLGLDTTTIHSPDDVALFDPAEVACTLVVEGDEQRLAVRDAPQLRVTPLTPSAFALSSGLPPMPNLRAPGGHVVLTSGTTGRHKKVLKRRGETAEPIAAWRERYQRLGDGFRAIENDAVVSLFDFGLWASAGYSWPIQIWCHKGAVAFLQQENLEGAIVWPGLTHAVITPYLLARLMALPAVAFEPNPNLQLVITAGLISPALLKETQERLTRRILLSYGASEAGGWARTVVKTEDDLRWQTIDPDRRVEVVDDADLPVPVGVLGRLRVALRDDGPRGYHGDAGAAAGAFQGEWFYPGDLGVLDPLGRVTVHGRVSAVIHIQGDKYPAEPLEAAIQNKLACEGVCILSGRWSGEEEELDVFIEARRPVTAEALSEALRSTLFGFRNVRVHHVEALPRTALGKVKRETLARNLYGMRSGVAGEDETESDNGR